MPAHPVALELIRRAGVPVAAPSANLFGHISPTTAAHVLEDLDGRIDAVVDAGATEHGVESTVLDPCQSPMTIYRPGAVTSVQIWDTLGAEGATAVYEAGELRETPREALPSPGVGLRHYAPRARLVLVECALEGMAEKLAETVRGLDGERIGAMLPEELARAVEGVAIFPWGRWADAAEMARTLYAGLRALDAAGCSVIVCPLPAEVGVGAAIRDRLMKAGNRE